MISTLKAACKPAFTSIKVDWGIDQLAVEFQSPDDLHMDNVYEGESLNIFAVLNKWYLESGPKQVTIKLMNTLTQKECTH